jgi:prophage DNA circulation protein
VTRPGKSPRGQTLSELFASDAEAAVLRVLREANAALNAIEVKKALHAGGVSKADADKAWRTVQKRVKTHDHVTAEGNRYRWTDEPRRISAMEAVELIAKGRLAAPQKAKLVAIVRAALEKPPVDLEAAARRRQAEIDAVRALAELAIEVEELTANQASARAMVHRVRAHVKLTNLEPIDRAGEEARSIGSGINRSGGRLVTERP